MAFSEVRQKFEAWLGLETCPVHSDESAEKNAWYGFAEGMRAGEIARWIPVEKLPDKSGEYLVVESGDTEASSADFFIELPNVEKSKWMTVRSFGQDGESRELFNVTHWQPLPAAPQSGPSGK